MAFQNAQGSPKVVSREFDLSGSIAAVPTTDCGIAGVYRWGPVGVRTLVDFENVLVKLFGAPTNYNAETWFVGAQYLAYANRLHVVRAGDTTGNTEVKAFTGNSTNLAATNGSANVQVNNAIGLIEGQVLFYSNNVGVPAGAKIADITGQIVTLDKNATANLEAIQLVFRDDILYTAVGQEVKDYTIDWDAQIVKSEAHYEAGNIAFDDSIQWVARFPGDIGNSLRVSAVDNANQYASSFDLSPNAQFGSNTSVITAEVGSNTLTVVIAPANTANAGQVTTTNDYAANVKAAIATNDLIRVGNNKIGYQDLKVTAVSSVTTSAGNVHSFSISVDDEFKLSSNVSSDTLNRYWEFYNFVDVAPGQSSYQLNNGNTAANDEVHIVVVDEKGKFTGSPGAILEVYKGLSRATDAKNLDGDTNYFKNVVNQKSQYLWYANDRSTAVSATAENLASASGILPYDVQFHGGGDGLGENDIALSNIMQAYDQFASKEDSDISLLLTGKSRSTTLPNYIYDNIVSKREDCVLFVSPQFGDVVNNVDNETDAVIAFFNNIRDSSYIFTDNNYKYMYDRYNDVYRWIPLNGDMAGLAARTDFTNDAWWSFAGLNRGQIKNVVKLAWNPREAQRDTLYRSNINSVVAFPGEGPVLWGDKTHLNKDSAFNRINVRRLFIVLRKAISRYARALLFEFNDDFTRAQFRNVVNPYLRDIKGRRGIYDFLIRCDSTNNDAEVLARNEFIGDIFIKPAKSINFIGLNFIAVRDSVSFSEISGVKF